MKIQITYKLFSFHGVVQYHTYVATSEEEAEEICKRIENTPEYFITDVTRIE